MIKIICTNCGNDFIGNKNRKFCCRVCANKFNAEKLSINRIGKNNPMYGKRPWNKDIPRTKEQKKHHSKIMKELYNQGVSNLGFQIGNKTKSQYKDGLEHPNYIDGRKYFNYPEEFNNILRIKILKRDNYKCCWFNKNDECIKKLSIHHIDFNKNNNKEDNLITLCTRHNSKANFKREYCIKYFNKLTDTYVK